MNKREIGKQVALLRKQRGWDQSELARRAGVSRAFVCNLERGKGGDPGLQKVLNILALFSYTLEVKEEDTSPPTLDELLKEQEY